MLKTLLTSHQRPRVIDLLSALENNPELAADAARKVSRGLVALRQSSTFVKFAIGRYMRAVRVVQQLLRRIFARNIAMRQRGLHEWTKRQEQLWTSGNTAIAVRRPPSDAVRERVIREEFVAQRRQFAAVWRLWRKTQLSLQSQLREVTTELHSAFERASFSPIALKHLQDRMAFLNHRLQHHETAQPRYHGLDVDLEALDARVAVVMRKEVTERVVSAMGTIGVHTEDNAFMDTVVRRYEEVLEAEHARKRMQRTSAPAGPGATSAGLRRRTIAGDSTNMSIAAMTRKKSHSIMTAQRVLTQPAAQVPALASMFSGGSTTLLSATTGNGDPQQLQRLASSLSMSSVATRHSVSTMEPPTPNARHQGGSVGGLQRRPSRSRLIRFDSADMVPKENSFLPAQPEVLTATILKDSADKRKGKNDDVKLTLSIIAEEYPEHSDLGHSILTPKDKRKFSSFRSSSMSGIDDADDISLDPRRSQGTADVNVDSAILARSTDTLLLEPKSPNKIPIGARQCFKALGIPLDVLAFPVEAPGVKKFSEFVHAARVASGFADTCASAQHRSGVPRSPVEPRPVDPLTPTRPRSSHKAIVIKELPRCPPRQPHSDRGFDLLSPRLNRSAQLRQQVPIHAPSRRVFTLGAGVAADVGARATECANPLSEASHEVEGVASDAPAESSPALQFGSHMPQHASVRRASPPRKLKTDTNLEGCREVHRQRFRAQHPPPRPPIDLPDPIPLEWLARPPSPPFRLIDEELAADLQENGRSVVTITAAPIDDTVLATDGHTDTDKTNPTPVIASQPAATFGVVSIMTDGTVRVGGLAPKAYSAMHCTAPSFTARGSSAASSLSLMPVTSLPTLSRVVTAMHVLDVAPMPHSQSSIDKAPHTMIAVACSDGSLRVYSLRSDMQETCLFSDCPTSREPFTSIELCGQLFLCVACEDNTVYTYAYGEQPQPPAASSHGSHLFGGAAAASTIRGVALMTSPTISVGAQSSTSRQASPQLTRRYSHVPNGSSRAQRPLPRSWASWGKLAQPTTITHMTAVTPSTAQQQPSSSAGGSSTMCSPRTPSILAVSTYDHSIHLWDVSDGSVLAKLEDHTQGVHYMFMSRATNYLVSCSYDSTVRLWDVAKSCALDEEQSLGSSQNELKPGGVSRVAGGLSAEPSVVPADAFVSPTGSPKIASRKPQFHQRTRSVDSEGTYDDVDLPFHGSPSLRSEDGRGGGGGGFASSMAFTRHRQAVLHAVDVSGKDRLVASISQDGTIQMWDQMTLEAHFVISDVPGHLFIGCVAFPAASLLAYVFADQTLRVFSSTSGKLQSETKLQHAPKTVVKLSHLGLLGIGSTSGHVRVFNAEGGNFVTTSDKLHNATVTCMTAMTSSSSQTPPSSQHLSLLVTGGEDRAVHLSRMPTIRPPAERLHHSSPQAIAA